MCVFYSFLGHQSLFNIIVLPLLHAVYLEYVDGVLVKDEIESM